MPRTITAFDIKVYEAVYQYFEKHGPSAPSRREIADAIGSQSTSQVGHSLDKLHDVGALRVQDGTPRGLRLAGEVWEIPSKYVLKVGTLVDTKHD